MQEILNNLEGMEIDEAAAEVNDAEWPMFMRTDETQEFAPSSEVQAAEIREAFLDIPELRYENWVELNGEQRVAALNELEQQVAEIAMRDPMDVQMAAFEKDTLMGTFDGTTLRIADHSLMDNSYDGYTETLNTLLHEGRHAYQDYNLYVERVEQSQELVDSWKVNNVDLGYDNGDRLIFKDRGYLEYYTQPVEVDARVFAETVINELGL
ncbi:hypothetical protein B5F29_08975 [Lachnoclostridium sp. An196]|uniref:hypothetical protein n=1 Tax=Lachnoclostridium sp. An196 TaxID=1965583 RepID=UPI000B37E61E|nr:hypothetical protein [Lachnoclostridium sp. An196]OUP19454.1 hypothetical protein B5F29_08975 [Lachnoclostridium sp. An196]